MVGCFERLSDLEWKLFEDLFAHYTHWSRKPECRPVPLRGVLNSQLYILITGFGGVTCHAVLAQPPRVLCIGILRFGVIWVF